MRERGERRGANLSSKRAAAAAVAALGWSQMKMARAIGGMPKSAQTVTVPPLPPVLLAMASPKRGKGNKSWIHCRHCADRSAKTAAAAAQTKSARGGDEMR